MTVVMSAVRDRASLHEKAVQAIARGEVKPRRTRRASQNRNSPVRYLRLDPRVLAAVKKINADPRHVQVVSSSEVIIWNHPAPWPV